MWKPLNVITLGQTETDSNNRIITISKRRLGIKESFYLFNLDQFDHINRLITLPIIALIDLH